jgi:hypothetical protein
MPNEESGFDVISSCFRHVIGRFTFVRLLNRHLTPYDAFSPTLTTTPFERSSSGWFEASSCQRASEGLPPSFTQREKSVPDLHHVTDLSSWHTVGA